MKDKIVVLKYAPGSRVKVPDTGMDGVIDNITIFRGAFIYHITW